MSTREAQTRATAAYRARKASGGYKALNVWITADAHAWLHSMALNRSVSVATMVQKLIEETMP